MFPVCAEGLAGSNRLASVGGRLAQQVNGKDSAGRVLAPVAPVVGPDAAMTRLFGWTLGASLTSAVGVTSSAPGQVPIEDLNIVLAILQKSIGGK